MRATTQTPESERLRAPSLTYALHPAVPFCDDELVAAIDFSERFGLQLCVVCVLRSSNAAQTPGGGSFVQRDGREQEASLDPSTAERIASAWALIEDLKLRLSFAAGTAFSVEMGEDFVAALCSYVKRSCSEIVAIGGRALRHDSGLSLGVTEMVFGCPVVLLPRSLETQA